MSGRDESSAVADAAGRLFAEFAPQRVIEAAEEGHFAHELWTAVVASGLHRACVAEDEGGPESSVLDAAAIMRAAGAHALPLPLLESIVANRAAAGAGLPVGDAPTALVFLSPGEFAADTGLALADGTLDWPWACAVDRAVLIVPPEGGRGGARVAVAHRTGAVGGADRPLDDLHGEARGAVPMRALEIVACRVLPGTDAFEDLHLLASLLRAEQMLGALEWIVDRTIAYAGERQQFGRRIGQFQIVQQMLAQMASEVVAASAIVSAAEEAYRAAGAAGAGAMLAAARSVLGDAVDVAVAVAHQVHGAIGFSRAYALNFRTRRLMAWRDEFGSVARWRGELAAGFAGRPANAVWPAICESFAAVYGSAEA